MVVMVMFWFGFFSGFSGQQFTNDWIYLYYNVMFTATPIIVLAVLDQSLKRESLENNPKAYKSILRGHYFNKRLFYTWVGRAFWHSLIIYFFCYGSLGVVDVSRADGLTNGMWYFSTVAYTCVVMVATLRILLEFNSMTVIHHFFVWLSFFGYYFVLWLINLGPVLDFDMIGLIPRIYGSGITWLVILLVVAIPILIDFTVYAILREFKPTIVQIMQEREKMKKEDLNMLPIALTPTKTSSVAAHVAVQMAPFKEQNNREPRFGCCPPCVRHLPSLLVAGWFYVRVWSQRAGGRAACGARGIHRVCNCTLSPFCTFQGAELTAAVPFWRHHSRATRRADASAAAAAR